MGGSRHVILPPTNRESHREVEIYSEAQTDARHPPLTVARLTHALSLRCSSFAHPEEKHLCTLTGSHLLGVQASGASHCSPTMTEEGRHKTYPIARAELG